MLLAALRLGLGMGDLSRALRGRLGPELAAAADKHHVDRDGDAAAACAGNAYRAPRAAKAASLALLAAAP